MLVLEMCEVWEPDRENAVAAAKTVARKATIGNAGPNTRMMLSGIPGNAALPVLPTLPLPAERPRCGRCGGGNNRVTTAHEAGNKDNCDGTAPPLFW